MKYWDAALYLENGHLFMGKGLGAEKCSGGEIVFNTGMTGYQEIFTDPSYSHQIVVMTYPHIGNTGVNASDVESRGIFLSGIVIRDYPQKSSSWRSEKDLADYLADADIPAISELDTRSLTQCVRNEGAQRAVIIPVGLSGKTSPKDIGKSALEKVAAMEGLELVSKVSTASPYEFTATTSFGRETQVSDRNYPDPERSEGEGSRLGTVVVYDFGVKRNILHLLKERGFRVWVVPHQMPYQEVLSHKPVAVVLSNGPGDPATVKGASEISSLIGKVPILAICMGHQLLARCLGAATYKLKFGHHGVNHPVKDLKTGRILITSQNHGFAVDKDGLKNKDIELSHISLNDHTVEGFMSSKMRFHSFQFHPEASPGPHDAHYLFDNFVRGFLK